MVENSLLLNSPSQNEVSTIVLLFVFGKSFGEICLKIHNFLTMYTLAPLNYTLSVSEYVTTNVAAKPVTYLHGRNNGCAVVSHMCSCNTLTVTRK